MIALKSIKLIDNLLIYFHRYYYLESCTASLDKLFLDDANKYCGPMLPVEDILLQLATGLEYIHEMKLVHGDLNPENALICEMPNQDHIQQAQRQVVMKWADFSLSKRRANESDETAVHWLAPEILTEWFNNANYDESKSGQLITGATKQSDVFSEGLTFAYALLAGEHPYGTDGASIVNNLKINNPVHLNSNLLKDDHIM